MQEREPRRLSLRLLTLLVTGTLFCLSLHHTVTSEAAARSSDNQHVLSSPSLKQSHTRGTPASLAPGTVQNLRVMTSPEKTRLVLDLDRLVNVVEQQEENPSRVIFTLSDAWLTPSALTKIADGTVPSPVTIAQSSPHTVTISLPTASFGTYKHFALSNPPRIVVDYTPPAEPNAVAVDEAHVSSQDTGTPAPRLTAPHTKRYTTIVIDPGHGGKDPGARGIRKTEEKDITLKVGLHLRKLLSKQSGVRVLMTRDHDVFVELEERARFANSNEADLFVSIHVNSHPSRTVKGIEIYHFGEAKDQRALEVAARENGTPISNTGVGWEYLVADLLTTKKIEESLELAWNAKAAMVAQMNGHYEVDDHGVKTAPFYVLRFTSMPSILAEIAYISNPIEEELLQKSAFVQDVARSLYQGIVAFLSAGKSDIR